MGSCLKTGQHSIFVILYIYLLLPIKYIFYDSVSKILFRGMKQGGIIKDLS